MSAAVSPIDFMTLASELSSFLASARNADGGWAYYRGNRSRLEPTCWALLATTADARVLATWPAAGGLLQEHQTAAPNYAFHGLALLTFRALRLEHAAGSQVLLASIQRARGEKIPASTVNRQ